MDYLVCHSRGESSLTTLTATVSIQPESWYGNANQEKPPYMLPGLQEHPDPNSLLRSHSDMEV